MTDLEYAELIARELIPLPEMAGSEQLRRSIVKAVLRSKSEEAHRIGVKFVGGYATSVCFDRARFLRQLSDDPKQEMAKGDV